jgi:hypothetical protein
MGWARLESSSDEWVFGMGHAFSMSNRELSKEAPGRIGRSNSIPGEYFTVQRVDVPDLVEEMN